MKKELKYVVAFFIPILFILTIFDLSISEKLFDSTSRFGWFFESFGELVLSFIGLFSASVLFRTQKNNKVVMRILFGFLAVFNGFMAATLNKMYLNLSTVVMLILLFVYLGVFYYLASFVKEDAELLVRKIAKVGLLLSLLPILIVTVLKMIWGRQRFRSMTNPSSEFTPWYMIQKVTTDNEFMSFPSGHSANSATVIWITLLPLWLQKLQPYRYVLILGVTLWTICVMISRIIMGAHFATDVFMGSMITVFLFIYLKYYYLKDELVNDSLI